ncbi:MAG: hypothetical protein ACPGJS_13775 [Flammeovirgaceae bacterium]
MKIKHVFSLFWLCVLTVSLLSCSNPTTSTRDFAGSLEGIYQDAIGNTIIATRTGTNERTLSNLTGRVLTEQLKLSITAHQVNPRSVRDVKNISYQTSSNQVNFDQYEIKRKGNTVRSISLSIQGYFLGVKS